MFCDINRYTAGKLFFTSFLPQHRIVSLHCYFMLMFRLRSYYILTLNYPEGLFCKMNNGNMLQSER